MITIISAEEQQPNPKRKSVADIKTRYQWLHKIKNQLQEFKKKNQIRIQKIQQTQTFTFQALKKMFTHAKTQTQCIDQEPKRENSKTMASFHWWMLKCFIFKRYKKIFHW